MGDGSQCLLRRWFDVAVIPYEKRKVIQAPDDFEIPVNVVRERQRIYVPITPVPEGYELRVVEHARSRMHGKFR